ncbi:MAG TPA: right-handed parallel beta-helix repeat-containing protein, partial [Polyangiaceae bacterium]
ATADVSVDASPDATPPADAADGAPSCALQDSPPIVASSDGQVIENLRIVAKGTPGISISGRKNVVVRNVVVLHEGASGIALANADGARLENVVVEHTGAPASGANDSSSRNNIDCYATSKLVVAGARLTRGSSGIYLDTCALASLTQIEGYDFRGPFPRGQLVQFNASDGGLLDGFSVVNGHTSWPEDNVNVYKSKGIAIRNGLVDGNNSPSGVGVIFDGDTGAGLVEDVDAVHMGNGCFSNYAGADGNIFRRVRCRDNVCTSQDGRGAPSSGALMFCGKPSGSNNTVVEQAKYFASCNGNVSWPSASFSTLDLKSEDFVPRAALKQTFCWE